MTRNIFLRIFSLILFGSIINSCEDEDELVDEEDDVDVEDFFEGEEVDLLLLLLFVVLVEVDEEKEVLLLLILLLEVEVEIVVIDEFVVFVFPIDSCDDNKTFSCFEFLRFFVDGTIFSFDSDEV